MREAAGESEVDEDEGFVEGAAEEEAAARELKREGKRREPGDGDVNYEAAARKAGLPPQTVVARVIRELEDDFTHYKRYLFIYCVWFYVADARCFFLFLSSVYCELADQYKEMDAVSDVPRRNMLAKHLREVVDILEQKVCLCASGPSCSFAHPRCARVTGRPNRVVVRLLDVQG
jgi:hypothetical protein